MSIGKVWLVGAGPSDAGLFTLKGKAVLEQAEVVVYDQLVGDGILRMIPNSAKKIDVGKHAGNHKVVQERINEILLEEALEGKRVVRLKGGDPFLFGRGGEELELLCEHKVPFEIVPGITSAISVPAYAGIPVTHRDYTSSLHIITGHKKKGCDDPLDYKAFVGLGEVTLVFLMSVAALPDISAGLIAAGMSQDMPAAILEKGTTARQRKVVATIATLPEEAKKHNIGTPGIIVVGRVCSLSDAFSWAEKRPLGGARVIVTRPRRKSSTLSSKLQQLGAEVIELPSIQTVPIGNNKTLSEVLHHCEEYQWIAFTSEAAVEVFFDTMIHEKIDIRNLLPCHLAAVGPATKKALEKKGLHVDYMPEEYYGAKMAAGLETIIGKQDAILVLTPSEVDSELAKHLEETDANMTEVPVYEIQYEENDQVPIQETDYVAFTSASTVRGFVKSNKELELSTVHAICIGEQTAKEARKYNMRVSVSKEATIDSMIEEILAIHNKTEETQ